LRIGFDEVSALNDILIISRNELEKNNLKLVALDGMKNNFISMVSHELRTPLTAIKGFLSFLDKGAAGPLNPQQKEYIATISRNAERLLSLICDLLDMSKIESGTFSVTIAPCDLKSVVDNAVVDLDSIAQNRQISLARKYSPGKLNANVDSYRISQVVINLLNNALKFTAAGSEIRIYIDTLDFEALTFPRYIITAGIKTCSYHIVSVEDDGAGIPENQHEKVFEKFYQITSSTYSKPQGIGLGLPITREIIGKHGGLIWSQPGRDGKGTRFTFILPAE
jgi:signal transduction histidine kinase